MDGGSSRRLVIAAQNIGNSLVDRAPSSFLFIVSSSCHRLIVNTSLHCMVSVYSLGSRLCYILKITKRLTESKKRSARSSTTETPAVKR